MGVRGLIAPAKSGVWGGSPNAKRRNPRSRRAGVFMFVTLQSERSFTATDVTEASVVGVDELSFVV